MKREFMDKLHNDPELKQMREEYNKIGVCMPGYNYDEYSSLEDYKEKCRMKLKKLQEKASVDK